MTKQSKSYSELSKELQDIISKLEDPSTSIDDALIIYKAGDKLVSMLKDYLENMQNEFTDISKKIK